MLRLSSFLMVIVLIAPMARECCLPVTQALPCHETQHTVDLTCYSGLQAIAETKASLGVGMSVACEAVIAHEAVLGPVINKREISTTSRSDPTPPGDIYLRTGALLI